MFSASLKKPPNLGPGIEKLLRWKEASRCSQSGDFLAEITSGDRPAARAILFKPGKDTPP